MPASQNTHRPRSDPGTPSKEKPSSTLSVDFDIDSTKGLVIRSVLLKGGVRRSQIPISNIPQTKIDKLELHDASWLRLKKKPEVKSPINTVRLCDLFSGCGGISAGVEEACRSLQMAIEPVLAWDVLEGAKRTYQRNFSPKYFRDDPIEEIIDGELGDPPTNSEEELLSQLGQVDVVVGGPPCQGHSDLNNHSRRDDSRNELYMRMTRFIEITKPKIALIENVLTVRRAKSEVVQRTVEFLRSLGYGVDQQAIRAIDLGVPQDRRRHFTIATLGKQPPLEAIKAKRIDQPRSVMWGINDLMDVEGTTTFDTPARHQIQNLERIAWLFGEGWESWEVEQFNTSGNPDKPEAHNLPNHRRPKCHQNGHNYPAVYGRMFSSLPSPTITTGFGSTGQGRFVHPHKQRSLTPHEAARVQGFPDFFDFSTETGRVSLQTLIGNAVPPMMAEHILLPLLTLYEEWS